MTCPVLSRRPSGATRPVNRHSRLFTALIALLVLLLLAAMTAACAGAAISDAEELTRFGSEGAAAGQLELPSGIATDPVTGHVYIASTSLHTRVDEFTPWGEFVKAFGWDVAPGAVNEQQEVRVRAAAGQFKLTFGASTTPDLAFDAPGSEAEGSGSVEAALDALSSIGGAGGSVSVRAVPGTTDGVVPYVYVVAFRGALAGSNVAQLAISNGTTPLSGGVPSPGFEVRTRADGTAGGAGLESCTAESGCKAGLQGAGAGEFDTAYGLAVDATGDVYVKEVGNRRVQKFDSAGRFLLMFGGEVDKTKSAEVGSTQAERNRCTGAELEAGDECGVGTTGTGPGQFAVGQGLALGTGGALFAADAERIQRFNLEGEFQASVPVPGKLVEYLAVDPVSGDLYAKLDSGGNLYKLNPTTGAVLSQIEDEGASVLATDPAGNVYSTGHGSTAAAVFEFDAGGNPLSPSSCCEAGLLPPPNLGENHFQLDALATNAIGDLYVGYGSPSVDSFVRAFGPGPATFEAPPPVPPSIVAQFASSVQSDGASVAAEINPHFWSDAHYFVQYGTGRCSEGGCESQLPVSPGALLTSKVSGSPLRTPAIFLAGLTPGTTYHYRFVANSSGGGPAAGEEMSFTTFASLTPKPCSNDVFRTGLAAGLPDCRAYEMVSPIDKDNGDIKTLLDFSNYGTSLGQSAGDGEKLTYSSYRAFGVPEGAAYTDQYLAVRDPEAGWSSQALDVDQHSHFAGDSSLENAYKAFSGDLCSAWLVVAARPVLAAGAIEGYRDVYRRDDCGAGGYEALIQGTPPAGAGGFYPVLQGTSGDGRDAVVQASDKLTPEAASGPFQSYYASAGALRLLCVLPSGLPTAGNCSAGGGTGPELKDPPELERYASLDHAISSDGSRVYWTDSGGIASGPGKVFLRENPGQPQSALSGEECVEPKKACTVKVSETVSATKPARFLDASSDATSALFQITEGTLDGNLYEFELVAGGSTLLAGKVLGVAGASEDLSRIYFVSEEALPGTTGATLGRPNLYLRETGGEGGEASVTFIATLSALDVANRVPSDATFQPIFHVARSTPDGRVLTFVSTESLTGYDNTDLQTGEADSEVYVYEAGAPGPVCVSCEPSGARPTGRAVRSNSATALSMAGSLKKPENDLYSPRVLSGDGRRVFFDSFDALLPRDTNGTEDVYEWESAPSREACEAKGADSYVAASRGCLSLISSGESPQDSEFLDASLTGDDVFFTTNASLVPQDPGLIDVYDARVDGGFPAPAAPPAACEGEACQGPLVPPADSTPASSVFSGPGNLAPLLTTTKLTVKPAVKRCRKAMVRKHGRCVKKRHAARKSAAKRRTPGTPVHSVNRDRGAGQ